MKGELRCGAVSWLLELSVTEGGVPEGQTFLTLPHGARGGWAVMESI